MRISRRAWFVVDSLLVIVALVTVGHAAARYLDLRTARSGVYPPLLVRGRVPGIPSVKWAGARRHVVLRLSSTCPICEKSIPFYQAVSACAHLAAGTQFTVVTNESPALVGKWLEVRGVHPDQLVRVADPSALGFLLIPTVLLTDSAGTVTDILVGEATEADQGLFLSKVSGQPSLAVIDNTDYAEEIDSAELKRRALGRTTTVLDIRDRRRFGADHWPGAVNIPIDEISTRGAIELGAQQNLALDCRDLSPIVCRSTARTLKRSNHSRVVALLR